jgi:hypothetical protein
MLKDVLRREIHEIGREIMSQIMTFTQKYVKLQKSTIFFPRVVVLIGYVIVVRI